MVLFFFTPIFTLFYVYLVCSHYYFSEFFPLCFLNYIFDYLRIILTPMFFVICSINSFLCALEDNWLSLRRINYYASTF